MGGYPDTSGSKSEAIRINLNEEETSEVSWKCPEIPDMPEGRGRGYGILMNGGPAYCGRL